MKKNELDVFPLIAICLYLAEQVKNSCTHPDEKFNNRFDEHIMYLIAHLLEGLERGCDDGWRIHKRRFNFHTHHPVSL